MELLLQILLFLLAAKIGGELVERVKLPSVIGELMAGIILGPTILNIISPDPIMEDISYLGIVLLMFLAGLETDFDKMKSTGVISMLSAIGGVVVPFLLAISLGIIYHWNYTESLFLGCILVATSVGITVRALMEIHKLNTPVGTTILGAAVIDDIIGILIFTIVRGISLHQNVSFLNFLKLTGIIILFFVVSLTVGFWISEKIDRLKTRMHTQEASLCASIIFVLVLALLAEHIGVAGITGAFIAGILMSKSPRKGIMADKIGALGYGFFVPLFFVYIGINTNLSTIPGLSLTVLVITIAIVGKLLGCGVMAYISGFSLPESVQVGIGMVPRMEVALIIASIGLTAGVMSLSLYSLTVTMVLVTTLITPILIRVTFK
jgi:Kef-type K+ transport system membrane component KefB